MEIEHVQPEDIEKRSFEIITQELSEMGLRVPQIASVMGELRRHGYPIPEDVYNVEQARRAVLSCLKGGERSC